MIAKPFLSLALCVCGLSVASLCKASTPHSGATLQTPQDQAPKPLTRLLSASFGDMHDVVSHTEFINAVTDGKVTMAQLQAHLEQRALINDAVDRILRQAHVKPLPYGRRQREVLRLLRDNLHAVGAAWPAPADAWPLTQKMLDDINDSAKSGPYYALGVFHVYYGGITHGGRDIGGMIDKQLKTNLTYYSKSDGYDDYAREVNTIVDPAAQQEMIRGADEAYRYIISVNNLDVFK